MSKKWSNEDLIQAVKESLTLQDVAQKLKLATFGANSKTIKKYIKLLNLDTSHFNKFNLSEHLKKARKKRKVKTLEEIFVSNGEWCDTKYIKSVIIKNNLLPYECNICKLTDWQSKPIVLHMDHINTDNRLENLRFLCPNCHSQTNTYCGKNIPKKELIVNHCKVCNIVIHKDSLHCVKCMTKARLTKIIWPTINELTIMIKSSSFKHISKLLGISDNAIRKHLRKNNINPKSLTKKLIRAD